MINLSYPRGDFKITKKDGKLYIFDIIRKKNVQLTPEEWVRQHVVHYLVHHRSYPKALIKVEGGVYYNSMPKRSDIVVYDRELKVHLLIECKAPDVKLTEDTFQQIAMYNKKYNAQYLAMTNGMHSYILKMDYEIGNHTILDDFPERA